MRTKAFLKSRDQRKRVEMRFAHLKIHHGFERMRQRGLSGARDEFLRREPEPSSTRAARLAAKRTRLQRSYDPVRLPPEPPPVATLRPLPSPLTGSPPITRTTLPTCRAHYPGGSSGCACRLLPRSCSLPQMAGGSASALSLSRPAQASLTLRPARSLSRLWRPLSRGSGPAGYPAEPLVCYRINRQLSGWNLPPLMIRAFGAHGHNRTSALAVLRDEKAAS